MKFLAPVTLLAGLAAALPNRIEEIRSLESLEEITRAQSLVARQSSNTRNELTTGGSCPPVIFIWARGSTESGNMVGSLFPHPVPLHSQLTLSFPRVAWVPTQPMSSRRHMVLPTSGSKESAVLTRPTCWTTSSPTAQPPRLSPR